MYFAHVLTTAVRASLSTKTPAAFARYADRICAVWFKASFAAFVFFSSADSSKRQLFQPYPDGEAELAGKDPAHEWRHSISVSRPRARSRSETIWSISTVSTFIMWWDF